MTEEELLNKMAALMGGRAAEVLVFDKLSTGAADDLGQATNIARTMVTRYGMHDTLGQVAYDRERQSYLGQSDVYLPSAPNYSDRTAWLIDEAVRGLIDIAFRKATRILELHRQLLDETAETLLAKETLSADELPAVEPFEANHDTETSLFASAAASGQSKK